MRKGRLNFSQSITLAVFIIFTRQLNVTNRVKGIYRFANRFDGHCDGLSHHPLSLLRSPVFCLSVESDGGVGRFMFVAEAGFASNCEFAEALGVGMFSSEKGMLVRVKTEIRNAR